MKQHKKTDCISKRLEKMNVGRVMRSMPIIPEDDVYDEDGKILFSKKYTKWYRYDENGNLIFTKSIMIPFRYFNEEWWDYNNEGQKIYHKKYNSQSDTITEEFYEYTEDRHMISRTKDKDGETLREYDENNNLLSVKYPDNSQDIYKYDKKNRVIYSKEWNYEKWFDYNDENKLISTKEKYNDGLEILRKYDQDHNQIYYKESTGLEEWKEYDENNKLIHVKNTDGEEYWNIYDEDGNLVKKKIRTEKGYKYIECETKENKDDGFYGVYRFPKDTGKKKKKTKLEKFMLDKKAKKKEKH